MIFALKLALIPIEDESHLWITPRRGRIGVFIKQLDRYLINAHNFPIFPLYNNYFFQLYEQTSESHATMNAPTLS